ncbi:Hypothetical Protein FCC1311_046202 [Hondaea fermentalgiana]|uniref:Uncharacterized protein n=1 Tax=Hondaea fermentalgiana TaxID=2315210 RepID=A0A2R5GBP4_9STRA|nr:Hypothetical Protein FCC1311_046202 [Hondaea fermentalgiana]|eukprot:GBG28397.1 Hypothetical Protein FCC1311_046202 [Hondaea fermentalgiana]
MPLRRRKDLAGCWILAIAVLSGWRDNGGVRSCEAFLWTLTNYDLSSQVRTHEVSEDMSLHEGNALLGLVKFSVAEENLFEVNISATVSWRDATYATSEAGALALATFHPENASPELLVCTREEYYYIEESQMVSNGGFCSSLRDYDDTVCERIKLNLQTPSFFDESADDTTLAVYEAEIKGITARQDGMKYFVLSACDFVQEFQAPRLTELHSHAAFVLRTGAGLSAHSAAGELLRAGLLFLLATTLLGMALGFAYIRRWAPLRNTDLQIRILQITALKAGTLAFLDIGLFLRSAEESHAATLVAVDCIHALFLTSFCASLFVLILELALGKLITRHRLSYLDTFKIRRMVGTFTFTLLLYLLWYRSLLAWIFLCCTYVAITSSAHFLAASTVRVLQQQSSRIQAQLDDAEGNVVPSPVLDTLRRRKRFVNDLASVFRNLRVATVAFFCFAPFVLLLVQIILADSGRANALLRLLSELFDLVFLMRIAYLYRFVSFEPYLDASEEDIATSSSSTSHLSSFAQADVTASASAVYPIVDARDRALDHEKNGRDLETGAMQPERDAAAQLPVLCVSMPGQAPRMGVLHNYALLEEE